MTPEQARYRKKRYRLLVHQGIPTSLLAARPAARHLHRLESIGWTWCALEAITGVSDQALGNISMGRTAMIERRTAALIMAVPYSLAAPANLPDSTLMPATSAGRRIRGLLAMGWTRDHLNAMTDGVRIDHLARDMYPRMQAGRWRQVDALYERLHCTRGPSELIRGRAAKWGWPPPLAWDDVDDPDESPKGLRLKNDDGIDPVVVQRILAGEWDLRCNHAEREAVVRALHALGLSDGEIAARSPMVAMTVLRIRQRLNLPANDEWRAVIPDGRDRRRKDAETDAYHHDTKTGAA